jgi:hypothetical protein
VIVPAVQPAPSGLPDSTPTPASEPGTLAVTNAALRGGFVLLPRTLLHAPGLSRDAKLLYAVLLSYAWQAGSCFPGYARLQADLGCGINQVTKYLRELEDARLITRHRRGLGKTTRYVLHDPPAAPMVEAQAEAHDRTQVLAPAADAAPGSESGTDTAAPAPLLIHRISESALTESVKAASPLRRHQYQAEGYDSEEHHHHPGMPGAVPPSGDGRPRSLAPTVSVPKETTGAGDDDGDAALDSLLAYGVTRRIAEDLVRAHGAQAVRQQLQWQASRPAANSPAGALVRAIRDAWPPPPAWLESQERTAALARAAEEDARQREAEEVGRREQAARPPEERIAGRLQFWIMGQRARRREPTAAEIATRRAELLAELAGG